jgi:hypothetical protein
MQVAALYCVPNPEYVDDATTPEQCPYNTADVLVRVHYNFKALGDLKGTSYHYAEATEVNPQIIFNRYEIYKPERAAVVSVSDDEKYEIDNVSPPDGEFVTCGATRLVKAKPFYAKVPVPTPEY